MPPVGWRLLRTAGWATPSSCRGWGASRQPYWLIWIESFNRWSVLLSLLIKTKAFIQSWTQCFSLASMRVFWFCFFLALFQPKTRLRPVVKRSSNQPSRLIRRSYCAVLDFWIYRLFADCRSRLLAKRPWSPFCAAIFGKWVRRFVRIVEASIALPCARAMSRAPRCICPWWGWQACWLAPRGKSLHPLQ